MKKHWMILLFFFLLGILAPAFRASAQDQPRALVVSRGDYKGRANDLSPGPENDGENFRRILWQAYGDDVDITSLERGTAAETAEGLAGAIKDAFAESDAGDINYFYYSGHGDEDGMYLESSQSFSAEQLAEAFSGIEGANFLVIDCCYSGKLIARDASSESFLEQFLQEFQQALSAAKSRSAITKSSFHVLVASGEDEFSMQAAMNSAGDEMGFFTSAVSAGCGIDFTKVSSQSGYSCSAMADADRSGGITFGELYRYVDSVLYASNAAVWPDDDDTVFVPVAEDRIPDTAVAGVELSLDDGGTPMMEVSLDSGEDGIIQAALYQYTEVGEDEMSDLEMALVMAVEQEVTAYPYCDVYQAGSWAFSAESKTTAVSLPLGLSDLAAGKYFLLINERGGNTGCYLFPLEIDGDIPALWESGVSVQVKDTYSIENDGDLEIQVDFGSSAYPNCYTCPVVCTVANGAGGIVASLSVSETEAEWTGENYRHFCTFSWNGQNDDGSLVPSGDYLVTVSVADGKGTWKGERQIHVESGEDSGTPDSSHTQETSNTAASSDSSGAQETSNTGAPSSSSSPAQSSGLSAAVDISGMAVQLSSEQFVYNGKANCPNVTVAGLSYGSGYTVSYEGDMVNAGTVTVVVRGTGNYTGEIRRTYEILPVSIKKATKTLQSSLVYTGKARRAKITLRYAGKLLRQGQDYRLSYKNNKKIGYAQAIVRGIGNYSGSFTKKFKILPPALKRLRAARTGGSAWKLRWNRTGSVDGYELEYSTSAAFKKNVKKKTVGKAKKQITVKQKTSGKKYYFRMRTYKKINGKKWYSAWKRSS